MKSTIKTLFIFFSNFLFPVHCIWCRKIGVVLCQLCVDKIKVREITSFNWKYVICIFALFKYRKNYLLKMIISDFKYNGKFSKINTISIFLANLINKHFSCQKIILIPVPLHAQRKKLRWYNQADIIASQIKDKLKNNVSVNSLLLKRNKNTLCQTGLNRVERINNIKLAFSLNTYEYIDPHAILILVDDVLSTWITLESCAFELKKNYKNRIYWIVIASDCVNLR